MVCQLHINKNKKTKLREEQGFLPLLPEQEPACFYFPLFAHLPLFVTGYSGLQCNMQVVTLPKGGH
jgi:hypothetical protein